MAATERPPGVDPAPPADPADLALAAGLVREAARLAARMFTDGVSSTRKTSVSDIVTEADKAAEELIVTRLRAERPDDGVIGEEGSNAPGARTWYVDPVDGTYNYASGLPIWCAAVALTDEHGALLGAVYDPTHDQLFTGGRGIPATCNGVALEPATDRPLEAISVVYYLHPTTLDDDGVRLPLLRALSGAATTRSFGSGSVELCWVAAGRVGAYVQYDCLPWDWLPGAAIVAAAGLEARVVEHGGRRWHLAGPAPALRTMAAGITARDGAGS